MANSEPPIPPPLPPSPQPKASSLEMKVRAAPPGWAFRGSVVKPPPDPFTPPAGYYFLYGTLRDASMLIDILSLPSPPTLQAAYVLGYERKLWGQYPALIDGEPGDVVEGSLYYVDDIDAAEKLAAYETNNYRATACNIYTKDEDGSTPIEGYTFLFVGDDADLALGDFDLETWLKRVGRAPGKS